MQITVKGKQMDVGDSLREHVTDRMTAGVGKYFDHAIDATVTLSKETFEFRCDTTVHIGHGITMQSHSNGGDAYGAFESAAEKMEKQLRRYKRRLRDHHQAAREREAQEASLMSAAYSVIRPEEDEAKEESTDFAPLIVSESTTNIPELTVGEAVMRMELANSPVMMFRNRGNGDFNVVYRREDGNIGWIEPKVA